MAVVDYANPELMHRLYLALKTWGQCGCQFARDKRGVPVFGGVPLDRVRISKCSRCAAMQEYEATHPERVK